MYCTGLYVALSKTPLKCSTVPEGLTSCFPNSLPTKRHQRGVSTFTIFSRVQRALFLLTPLPLPLPLEYVHLEVLMRDVPFSRVFL